MGAAHMHVHQGLFLAAAEEAQLREDGDAGEPPVPDAEPALHRCVAVSGPQRPVVGGRRGVVPSVDVGRGMGCAQVRVSTVGERMVELCLLCGPAERPIVGGCRSRWPS